MAVSLGAPSQNGQGDGGPAGVHLLITNILLSISCVLTLEDGYNYCSILRMSLRRVTASSCQSLAPG